MSTKIEMSYRRGETKTRVQTGKRLFCASKHIKVEEAKTEPKERGRPHGDLLRGDSFDTLRFHEVPSFLFLVSYDVLSPLNPQDMLQHDPVTGNTRNVQRCGPWSRWQKTKRFLGGVTRALETGRPRKETPDVLS